MIQNQYIELSALQQMIKGRIGRIEQWVRVEIESHNESRGHHYFSVLEKTADGSIAARASAKIWRTNAGIIYNFRRQTGQDLVAGLSIVVLAVVDYHPTFGLSLIINDIDPTYSLGQRELERKETIRRLTEEGLLEEQKTLGLPFLPGRIAVISSRDAAGYGDFLKHLSESREGYRFDCTLFHSLVQGEGAPESIIGRLEEIQQDGGYDTILILRGGGAEADLFCFDDYELCRAIALCQVPVLTAIGHERDYHVADMVAYDHYKTPTALADALIGWVGEVEGEMLDALDAVVDAFRNRIDAEKRALESAVADLKYAFRTSLVLMDNAVALSNANIEAADPRAILRQGYVLAVGRDGTILKNVHSRNVGDEFSVRFNDGRWDCSINEIIKNQ